SPLDSSPDPTSRQESSCSGTPGRQGAPHCQFGSPTPPLDYSPTAHRLGGEKSQTLLVISRGEGDRLAWSASQKGFPPLPADACDPTSAARDGGPSREVYRDQG